MADGSKFLDKTGLSRLWEKIKAKFISSIKVNGSTLTPTNGSVDLGNILTSSALSNYLPLAGGTMTGTIKTSTLGTIIKNEGASRMAIEGNGPSISMYPSSHASAPNSVRLSVRNAADNGDVHLIMTNDDVTYKGQHVVTSNTGDFTRSLKGTVGSDANPDSFSIMNMRDNQSLVLYGGSSYTTGAYGAFKGTGHSDEPGSFKFTATNGTAAKALVGRPDGALTWGGSRVIVDASSDNNTIAIISELTASGDDYNGAFLRLHKRSASLDQNLRGAFSLAAKPYNADPIMLTGYTNGNLTWGGTPISLQGHTHDYLSTSGGTISGTAAQALTIKNSNANVTATSSSDTYKDISFTDANDNRIGVIRGYDRSDNRRQISLQVPKKDNTTLAGIVVSRDNDDNISVTSQTPAFESNGAEIATTKWVNDRCLTVDEKGQRSAGITYAASNGMNIATNIINNSYIQLCGGTDWDSGASIQLRGMYATPNPGRFIIQAKSTETNRQLIGYATGKLQWCDNDVICDMSPDETRIDLVSKLSNDGSYDGAFIRLHKRNAAITDPKLRGAFIVGAAVENSDPIVLAGYSDGSLTWNGTDVSLKGHTHTASEITDAAGNPPLTKVAGGTTDANGIWYSKYSDGTIIGHGRFTVSGTISVGATNAQEVTLPVQATSGQTLCVTASCSNFNCNASVVNNARDKFTVTIANLARSGNASASNVTVYYNFIAH